jgi:F-type H+-transporting ATPase subunit alpha
LRLELAQYYALAAFAQFGSDLDQTTRAQLERGQRLTELLKQPQYQPQELAHQVIGIFALTRGFARPVPASAIGSYAEGLIKHIAGTQPAIIRGIASQLELTDELEGSLSEAVAGYTRQAGYEVAEERA